MGRTWLGFHRLLGTLLLCTALAAPSASAAPDPERAQVMVRDVTERMLEVLRSEPPADAASEAAWLADRMRAIVAPTLDFVTMTKLAVGSHWLDAGDDQKRALVKQFRELLLGTYAKSLQEYDNQEIEFLPLRNGGRADRVKVRSKVIRSDGPEIAVHYSLRHHDGEWTVYDITVDGVSLVTNYRSTFTSEIQENGIDGLIETLRKKNAANAALAADQG